MLISRKKTPVTPTVPLLLGNLPLQKVETLKYLNITRHVLILSCADKVLKSKECPWFIVQEVV